MNDNDPSDDESIDKMNWERLARRELETRTRIDFDERTRKHVHDFAAAIGYDSDETTADALARLSDAEGGHRSWLEEILQDLVTAGVFGYDDPEYRLLQDGAELMDDLSTLAAASARGDVEAPTRSPGTDEPTADSVLHTLERARCDLAAARAEGTDPRTHDGVEPSLGTLADAGAAATTADAELHDDARDRVGRDLEQCAFEWEDRGFDREGVAAMLERFADVVRNGHTDLPENRGEWWRDVHGDDAEGSE